MKFNLHDRAEAIAGAIALGEASDEERREYRAHIASCSRCLDALGGEREIERVASTVSRAREVEVWEPDLGDVVATRMRRRSRSLRWGVSFFGVALAASFGIHFVLAAGIPRIAPPAASPVVINAGATRIVLEQNSAAPARPPAAVPALRRLIVTHNIVQMARAPVAAAVTVAPVSIKTENQPRQLVAITVHPGTPVQPVRHANVPVWRRSDTTSWQTVARTTTTSVTETAPQTLTHSAESLQISSGTREVAPVGGDTAINPQPPMIAYDEGAEGTTAFEVLVDDRGVPTKCVITKSAGYPVLDDTVCKAAMKARYTPKIVDGRAVPGVYRDAFTFHMSDQTSDTEGLRPAIPDGTHNMRQMPRPSDNPQDTIGHSGGGSPF